MSNDKSNRGPEIFNFRDEEKSYYITSKNEVLNKDVDWQSVLNDVIKHYNNNLTTIAEKCETSLECMQKVLNNDYSQLRFRSGACLIALHTIFVGS